jgi:hypothetical protein
LLVSYKRTVDDIDRAADAVPISDACGKGETASSPTNQVCRKRINVRDYESAKRRERVQIERLDRGVSCHVPAYIYVSLP